MEKAISVSKRKQQVVNHPDDFVTVLSVPERLRPDILLYWVSRNTARVLEIGKQVRGSPTTHRDRTY